MDTFLELNKSKSKSFNNIFSENSHLLKKIKFNKSAAGIKSLPLLLLQQKFKNKNYSNDWKGFSDQNVLIPKYILLKEDGNFYFIILFSEVVDKDIRFIKFLSGLISNQPENFSSEPGLTVIRKLPGAEADSDEWIKLVSEGKNLIKQKKLIKFVLSRQNQFQFSSEPKFSEIINQLKNNYPSCFIFLIQSGEKIFFGASPESFLRSTGENLVFEAVAGSVPRGNHIEEEISFEKRLTLDNKLRMEHQLVRDFILEKINRLLPAIKYSENSFIRKLDNIQHLVTKISIPVSEKILIFDFIDELFPTPAVCGIPKIEALELIAKLEIHERGLYSGLLGWFDINLNGELVAGIRSALYFNNKLIAYAGAGILEDSDPEEEFFETELKLQPILSLFKNE